MNTLTEAELKNKYKTRNKIMNTLTEAELKNKYKEKKRFTQELKGNQSILYSKLSFISKIVGNDKLHKTLKRKCKKWSTTHAKKIEKLQTENLSVKPKDVSDCPVKSVILNFSSYILSKEEEIALLYGLKNSVPDRLNRNGIMTEFEYFYQRISYHTTHLSCNEQEELKSKVRGICENYIKIRTPYKYKTVIQNLSQNRNIVLLNHDKGQEIVILNRTKYIKKCMNLINADQFRELKNDTTKCTETKLQNIL